MKHLPTLFLYLLCFSLGHMTCTFQLSLKRKKALQVAQVLSLYGYLAAKQGESASNVVGRVGKFININQR